MNIEYLEQLKKKNILILGFARSGYKTALILNKLGVKVTVNASDDLENNDQANELKSLGVDIISGSHPINILENIDIIVKNPGIPYTIPILVKAKEENIKIITEVELANNIFNNDIIAITGTNGKTTTTSITYEILKLANNNTKLAGNIGFPTIEVAYNNKEQAPIVMEISSFQLNGTECFKPKIAVITNLGEGHLDYHGSIAEYHNVKKKIFKNQDESDYLILNIRDKELFKNDNINSKIIYYSTEKNLNLRAYTDNGWFYFDGEKIFEISKLSLPGEHNLENAINSAIISILQGISVENIREILYTFKGVKHRLQYVGEHNDVKYYNDSKATNPTSTTKALSGFEKNVILLCGGKDRGIDFHELIPYFSKIKTMICVGESKEILSTLGEKYGVNILKATKIEDATILAYKTAVPGDIILLSPACASWDQYPSFEVRGEEFIATFEKIKNKGLI